MIFLGLLLRGLARLLSRIAFTLLVLLVALKVISFGLALYAEHHPRQVERLAGRLFGMPVQVARIETSWRGFTPRVWLRDLAVGEPGQRLHLGDVLAAVRLRALPWWPQTLPLALRLHGTHLKVVRDAQGVTRIVGLPTHHGNVGLPALLLFDDAVVEWEDHKRNGRLVEQGLDLQLISRGERRQLLVRSRRRDLVLRGELEGRLTAGHWSARFWARGRQLQIAPALRPYLPAELSLAPAKVDFQAWSQWRSGMHRASRLIVGAPKLGLRRVGQVPVVLERLGADLYYQAGDGRWSLALADLRFQVDDQTQAHGSALLRAEGDSLQATASKLQLGALAPLARLLPLTAQQREALADMAPAGELARLHLRLSASDPAHTWEAEGQLRDLRTWPWKKVPGVRQLDAHFQAEPGMARLWLHGEDTVIDLPRLFRQPLELGFLEGELTWRQTAPGSWRLDGAPLVAENRDIHTVTRLHLSKQAGAALFADIQTDFRNGDGSRAPRYYPVGIMKPKLVRWLDRAILFGRVAEGSFLLHGPLDHFPFHKTHDGRFEVLFQAEDLTLDYHKEWPPLQNGVASVRFLDNSLEIRAESSRLYDSEIQQAVARIPSLKPLAPLEVSGVVEGPLADELRLLRETPLKSRLARHVKGIELQGKGRLEATLRIPFKRHDYRFEGTLSFDDARFVWLPQKLAIERLKGKLQIDNHGLRGKEIRGRAFGHPVVLQVSPQQRSTRIQAEGKVTALALRQQFPLLKALQPRGNAAVQLTLDLPNERNGEPGEVALEIRSNLKGLALHLPPPLDKPADSQRELVFGLRVSQQGRKLTLRLGDELGLTAHIDPGNRLRLSAALSSLRLRPWIRWFQRQPAQGQPAPFRIDTLHLQAKDLQVFPLAPGPLTLDLRQQDGRWNGSVTSQALTGKVSLQPGSPRELLTLELETLRLVTTRPAEAAAAERGAVETPPDPRAIPLFRLHSRKFYFNRADLGELTIRTRADPAGQRIETVTLKGGLAQVAAQGSWHAGSRAEEQLTRLSGTLDTEDMGRFLRQGLLLDFLAGSKAHLSFDLSWSGAPFQFSLARLDGHLQLDMTSGRFLNIKPGAARILGLINVRTIGRRLKFDFKDLYEKGMAFDTILGTFELEDGLVFTNDLEISAPTSTIRIAGSTSLVEHTHDQLITVSPRLDATLPVAGAVVGGPVAGLVVLLAQQALSNQLEKIQRFRYVVTGSWDDPQVTALGKPKSTPSKTSPQDLLVR